MAEVRRHAPVGRYRAPRLKQRKADGLEHVRLGRARHTTGDVYGRGSTETRERNPLRWVLSQWLAALVLLPVTGIAIFGLLEDKSEEPLDLVQQLDAMANLTTAPARAVLPLRRRGLAWLSPKQDRLQLADTALTTRHIVHEQIQVRRDNRPFLQIKPYLRITARLAPASADYADIIPSFNPARLYAAADSGESTGPAVDTGFGSIETQIADLPRGELSSEDRQELQPFEVARIVREMIESDPGLPNVQFGLEQQLIDGLTPAYLGDDPLAATERSAPTNITTLVRTLDGDSAVLTASTQKREVRVIAAVAGDTLAALLMRSGAPERAAAAIGRSAEAFLPEGRLRPGQQVHVLAPSDDPQAIPLKVSVFDEAHAHRVTIKRRRSGAFVAQRDPDQEVLIGAMQDGNEHTNASLYASLYATGLAQGLQPEQIMKILRVHAADTDYRRQIRPGDTLDLFLELDSNEKGELVPGEIIYAALTTSGEERAFWRYRTPDGVVDFYNDEGQNNRKFLLRKPVRGNNARLTSGYGMRYHPILKRSRMHAGIDWAARTGTPIIAAGNGIVDFAGRKGANGNYVRIKHANGYMTSYSHMYRFGSGIREGARVRQGQVIGYVGSTGLSTGAHLHFEVMINGRTVDPLKIQVPRERTLAGEQLKEFQKERNRLLAVMRSPPVRVAER